MKGRAMVEISKFDAAEYLKTPEMIAVYLTDAFETDDPAFIARAIGTAARAKGMADVAKAAGVSRESLYKSLNGQSKPEFDTIHKVLGALGIRLVAEPIDNPKAA